jgi:predicted protein tyrosine phosphatase
VLVSGAAGNFVAPALGMSSNGFKAVIDMDRLATFNVARVLEFGTGLRAGDHLLVHCHAGVSRSTAAMTLILAQARPDSAAEEVMAEVVRIRKPAWPNLRMIELGDRMLGRDGALVAAVHARYAAVLARKPYKAETFTEAGRGREVRGATGA